MNVYGRALPEIGELVTVTVVEVSENEAHCHILEYDNILSYLSIRECSGRKIKSLKRDLPAGTNIPVRILSIDNKQVISLTRKDMSEQDKLNCADKYRNYKTTCGLIRRISEILKCQVDEIIPFMVSLYRANREPCKLFEQLAETEDFNVFGLFLQGYEVLSNSEILKLAKHKFPPVTYSVQCKVEVTFYGHNGISVIKDVLRKCKEQFPTVSITSFASPKYLFSSSGKNKETLLKLLIDSIEFAKCKMATHGPLGEVRASEIPRIV